MSGLITLPIETERLTIREMDEADAERLHRLYSDPIAMQHLATELPKTVAESAEWMQQKIDLHHRSGLSLWSIVLRESDLVIGDGGLQRLDDGTIEIGVRLVRSEWGHGYGREAAVALLKVGFRELGVERIVGITAPDNKPAIKSMESLGMLLVGREVHLGREWVVYEALAPER